MGNDAWVKITIKIEKMVKMVLKTLLPQCIATNIGYNNAKNTVGPLLAAKFSFLAIKKHFLDIFMILFPFKV